MQSTSNPKKRLALMPEVLPAPTKTEPNVSVRSRTMGHMHKMLAAAGAVASCSRPVTQPDNTLTIPPAPSATTAATDVPSALPTATAPPTATVVDTPPTATATATTPPTAPTVPVLPSTGYMVVDMLPSPARCYGAAGGMKHNAALKGDGTGHYAELTIEQPGSNMLVPSSASVWGGALIGSSGNGHRVVLKIRPNPGNSSLGASIDVSCGGQTGAVVATVQIPATKKVGDVLTSSLVDR